MATIRDRYILDVDTRGAIGGVNKFSGALGAIKGLGVPAALTAIGTAIAAVGAASIQAATQFEDYRNQLRLITDSAGDLEATLQVLNNAAVRNRASFAETVDLYTKLRVATEELGISNERILDVTGKFQQALALSGADANTAAGAIRQFGQAMASGTVRGDEFNSIVEALGPALAIMARESGISVGELRDLSQAGELTAETFFRMIENSNSLSAAFSNTEKTVSQLRQEISDATTNLLADLAEQTGALELYKEVLDGIARNIRLFADAQTDLESASVEELVNNEELGSAAQRLEELETRFRGLFNIINDAESFDLGESLTDEMIDRLALFGDNLDGSVDKIKAYREALREQVEVEQLAADAMSALQNTRDVYLQGWEPLTARISEYSKIQSDATTEIDRVSKAFNQTSEDLAILEGMLASGARSMWPEITQAIADTTEAHEFYRQKLQELKNEAAGITEFEDYYNSLMLSVNRSINELDNAAVAQQRLAEELANGSITTDQYDAAMERVNRTLGNTTNETKKLAEEMRRLDEATQSSLDSISERVERSQERAYLSGLTGLQRDLESIRLEEERLAEAAKERLETDFGGSISTEELQRQLDAIDRAAQAAIQQRQEAARTIEQNTQIIARQQEEQRRQTEEAQNTFARGWKDAFEEYSKNANNAAKNAGDIFNKVTRGMEDVIVDFAKTGKFEFKDFVSSVLEDLLRIQLRQTFSSIFGGGGDSGGGGNFFSDLFAGFFANGGLIPSGKFGVVGEAGPELISGPAQVTPLTGGSNVTYNINAVDASSFKQLVARDPGFIHAVAQKGANKIPTRR